MRIKYMSDLHLEFERSAGSIERFAASLDPTDCDVLVLAGDISSGQQIAEHVGVLAERFDKMPVLYVAGNHEYYGGNSVSVAQQQELLRTAFKHVHCLERNVVTVDGQRFLGTPLWYDYTVDVASQSQYWSDFAHIAGIRKWIDKSFQRDKAWLEAELREGDVVISHFLPSHQCVSPRWRGEMTNMFFVSDVEQLIVARKPKLWIHGHTHDSRDVRVGDTRIVCNPRGYVGQALNGNFEPVAVIDV